MSDFDSYVKSLKKGMTRGGAKWNMLKALYGADGSPVSSSQLMKLSGDQPEFARRLRELRDQSGADLVAEGSGQKAQWRLQSRKVIEESYNREYLTAKQKQKLFTEANFTCTVCRKSGLKPGSRGLQADHRVPNKRGGGNAIENWMALCFECNIAKRSTCQGCKEDCQTCAWAFPERVGIVVPIVIPREIFERLMIEGHTIEKLQAHFASQLPDKKS